MDTFIPDLVYSQPKTRHNSGVRPPDLDVLLHSAETTRYESAHERRLGLVNFNAVPYNSVSKEKANNRCRNYDAVPCHRISVLVSPSRCS